MKKFFALLLAAMMILSCATAMADHDTIINTDISTLQDTSEDVVEATNADLDVREAVTSYSDTTAFDTEGEMATELWLQVDATGQIDVTVPLVLVFQTNIDGGKATSPSTYKITNNSTADLVVTTIDVQPVAAKSGLDYSNQPMTLDPWQDADVEQENHYVARLAVGAAVAKGNGDSSTDVQNTGVYDLSIAKHQLARWNGGLFELAKATQGTGNAYTGKDTAIALTMKTGPLTFVTSREAGTDGDVMDLDKGVQLLTIKYTVAIDTSDAIGEEVTTAATAVAAGNVLDTSNGADTDAHQQLEPNTTSGAEKDNKD